MNEFLEILQHQSELSLLINRSTSEKYLHNKEFFFFSFGGLWAKRPVTVRFVNNIIKKSQQTILENTVKIHNGLSVAESYIDKSIKVTINVRYCELTVDKKNFIARALLRIDLNNDLCILYIFSSKCQFSFYIPIHVV